MSFAYVTGAAGGAPGNDGVPVLRGLDGVSATGVRFPSHVCFSARASGTSWCEAPEMCIHFGRFPLPRGPDFEGLIVFWVFVASHARPCARVATRGASCCAILWQKRRPMGPSSLNLSPCADVERLKLDGPRGGVENNPVAHFYYKL